MDPVTITLTAIGLALSVVGTVALVAWRYGRGDARLPAIMLASAILVLASPPLIQAATSALDPATPDAAGATHPEDAVVHPDELIRR